MPTVLLMLFALTAAVAVGIAASISAQRGTVRDQRSKLALAAAESGAHQAVLRVNRGAPPCTPTGTSWCQAPPGALSGTPYEGTYQVWIRYPASDRLEVVSEGKVGGVIRRVDVSGQKTQQPFLDGASLKAVKGIVLDQNSHVYAATHTNGNQFVDTNAGQCGLVTVGVGRSLTVSGNATYFLDSACTQPTTAYQQAPLTLPPVDQGDAAINNDNGRLFTLDPISGSASKVHWDPSTRVLTLDNNVSVTLTGSKYSFCQVNLGSNTSLYISPADPTTFVYLFFDSPEACNQASGTTQLSISSNARISTITGQPANAALLFVGSPTLATRALLSSNTVANAACVEKFIVYGPYTDIEMNSYSQFCGAMAGATVHLDQDAHFRTSLASQQFILPSDSPAYAIDHYGECSATSASLAAPASEC